MHTIVLTVPSALPCLAWTPSGPDTPPDQRCGQPATVAQAELLPDGAWKIWPICDQCVDSIAALYLDDDMAPLDDNPDDLY